MGAAPRAPGCQAGRGSRPASGSPPARHQSSCLPAAGVARLPRCRFARLQHCTVGTWTPPPPLPPPSSPLCRRRCLSRLPMRCSTPSPTWTTRAPTPRLGQPSPGDQASAAAHVRGPASADVLHRQGAQQLLQQLFACWPPTLLFAQAWVFWKPEARHVCVAFRGTEQVKWKVRRGGPGAGNAVQTTFLRRWFLRPGGIPLPNSPRFSGVASSKPPACLPLCRCPCLLSLSPRRRLLGTFQ